MGHMSVEGLEHHCCGYADLARLKRLTEDQSIWVHSGCALCKMRSGSSDGDCCVAGGITNQVHFMRFLHLALHLRHLWDVGALLTCTKSFLVHGMQTPWDHASPLLHPSFDCADREGWAGHPVVSGGTTQGQRANPEIVRFNLRRVLGSGANGTIVFEYVFPLSLVTLLILLICLTRGAYFVDIINYYVTPNYLYEVESNSEL